MTEEQKDILLKRVSDMSFLIGQMSVLIYELMILVSPLEYAEEYERTYLLRDKINEQIEKLFYES